MQQRDIVALGLTAAVLLGVYSTRKEAPASASTGPGPGPGPADANLQQARVLITTLEAQAANAPPAQREAIAQQLLSAATALQATSPQAAAELQAAAGRVRGGGGAAPPPQPPPQDAALQAARTLISQLESQAANASPGDRLVIATQLDAAAATVEGTSPQAASELRASANRVRGGTLPQPGGGAPPPAAPPPAAPPAPAPPVNAAALIQRYDGLKAKAEQYLADQTATIPMDTATLGAMDRTAADLAAAGDTARAQNMVALATASYQKRGLQRPIAMSL